MRYLSTDPVVRALERPTVLHGRTDDDLPAAYDRNTYVHEVKIHAPEFPDGKRRNETITREEYLRQTERTSPPCCTT